LLDLTATALTKDPALTNFAGKVSDSGEGRWTIKAAIDAAVPVPVLSTALYERFSSRGEATFGDKLLSAMRYEFGGHLEKTAGGGRACGRAGGETGGRRGKIEVYPDDDGVARKAGAVIAAAARAAVTSRGRFIMAVTGGHTPWTMLRALAADE